jgi:hypothetical protein
MWGLLPLFLANDSFTEGLTLITQGLATLPTHAVMGGLAARRVKYKCEKNLDACRCGANGNPSCAGANSDPVMYGFAGRSFNFIGDPGKTYNIISTQNLQARTPALFLHS